MRLRPLAACTLVALAWTTLAHAKRDPAFETKIDGQLAATDPALVPIFREATNALDDKKYDRAAELFAQVHEKAPNFTPATRRYCMTELGREQGQHALDLCHEAVAKERSADNLTTLAIVTYSNNRPDAKTEAENLVREAVGLEPDNVDANGTLCVFARDAHHLEPFRTCTKNLLRVRPDEPSTHLFAAQVAGNDEEWGEARRELERAHALGLKEVDYQNARAELETANPWHVRVLSIVKWVPLGWLALFALLALFGGVVAKPVRAQVERARKKPSAKTTFKSPTGLGELTRVTSLAYLSSGVLWIVLSLGTTIVIAAGAYSNDLVPWKIVATLAFFTIYLIISVVGSLRAPEDGRVDALIDLDEEPKWMALLERVEAVVGKKMPTKLALVEGKELTLIHEGSILARLSGAPAVGMILGKTAFETLDERTFAARLAQAVVATSGTDALGRATRFDLLLRETRASLQDAGSAGVFNPAYWLVRLAQVTFGAVATATREASDFLGDRAAVRAYGTKTLLAALEATDEDDSARRKQVESLPSGGDEEEEEDEEEVESLWELFKDAETAKDKLEGREPEPETRNERAKRRFGDQDDDDDAENDEAEDEDEPAPKKKESSKPSKIEESNDEDEDEDE